MAASGTCWWHKWRGSEPLGRQKGGVWVGQGCIEGQVALQLGREEVANLNPFKVWKWHCRVSFCYWLVFWQSSFGTKENYLHLGLWQLPKPSKKRSLGSKHWQIAKATGDPKTQVSQGHSLCIWHLVRWVCLLQVVGNAMLWGYIARLWRSWHWRTNRPSFEWLGMQNHPAIRPHRCVEDRVLVLFLVGE